MANYATLKGLIDQYITTNGQGDITGAILNDVLKGIVNSIGADYLFGGIVEPSSNVGTPDQNVFFIATEGGSYRYFDEVVIPDGITIFKWNGSWTYQIIFAGDGGVFDITAYHNNTKYADLTAALGTDGANVPQTLQKGGMSVKFVRSSDNKYMQYFLTKDEWSVSEADWEKLNLGEEIALFSQDVNILKAEVEGGSVSKIKTINTQEITSKTTYNTSISFPVKQGVTYRIYCKAATPLLQTNLQVFFRSTTADSAISTYGAYSNVDLSKGAYVDIVANTTTENAVLRLSYSGGAVVVGDTLSFEIEERIIFETNGLLNEAVQPVGNLAQLGYTSLEQCNKIGYYFIPSSWVNSVSELSQIDKSVAGTQNMFFINYSVGNNKAGFLFSAIGEMFVYANGIIQPVILDYYKSPSQGLLGDIQNNRGLSQKAAVKFVQDSLFSNPNDVFTYKDSGTGNRAIYISQNIKQGEIISYKNINCFGGNTLRFAYRINGSNTWFATNVQIGESGFFTMPVDADGIYAYLTATGNSSIEIGLIVIKQGSLYWEILNGVSSGFVTCNQSNLQVGVGTTAPNLPGSCISVGCNNLTRASGVKNITIGNDNMEDATGDENVSVGFHAGFRLTTGAHNTFIGSEAGDDNTTGRHNIAVGSHSLQRNNKGVGNVAVGYRALLGGNTDFPSGGGNRETSYNVVIGYDAACFLIGGYTNVAIGAEAMKNHVSTMHNVAIGAGALGGSTPVSDTVAIGHDAGKQADENNQFWLANSETDKEHALIFGLFSPSNLVNALLRFNAGKILMPNLPTSDPQTAGQLWNDNGTLKISNG